jgi:hypothetical protein
MKNSQIFLVCFLAGCGGNLGSTSSTTGGSAGSGGRSNGGTSAGTGGSTGAVSGLSSSTAGSGGASSTGGVPCGEGLVWDGDSCVAQECSSASIGEQCLLPDGGIGSCAAGTCHDRNAFSSDPSNCGGYGIQCPTGYDCLVGVCVFPPCSGGSSSPCGPPCSDAGCPTGMACSAEGPAPFCVWTSCGPATTDQDCAVGTQSGFCCRDQCVPYNSPANCGSCERPCEDGGPGPSCDAGQDNGFCLLADGGGGLCCQGACQDPAALAPPNCGACGLSCTTCQSDGDCPSGEACAISAGGALSSLGNSCASTSCSGATNGAACAIAGLVVPGNGSSDWITIENQAADGNEILATQCCGEACVDLNSDPSNCGACGVACPSGTACQFGFCQSAVACAQSAQGTACPFSATAEGICCGGRCVDPGSDSANCTDCGLACPPDAACTFQVCTLQDGGQVQPTAPSDCGGLDDGTMCAYPGQSAPGPAYCCAGVCAAAIGSFSTCVACGLGCPTCGLGCPGGTACVAGAEDEGSGSDLCLPLACDGNGNGDPCAFGPQGHYAAEGVWPSDWIRGSSACCSDTCVDLTQDPNNCGVCGLACPSGICALSGSIACLPSAPDDDCQETCGPWAVCVRGSCVDSSCSSFPYCAAQDGAVGMCCLGTTVGAQVWCSDLANDDENCGGCGFKCSSGQTCSHGVCSGSPPECAHRIGGFCNLDAGLGYLCCPGVGCTNTESDDDNCGTCGTSCPAGTTCQDGSCH